MPPLAAVGINQTAQKSVTGSLESLATALEPFKEMNADQLAELLRVAQDYRQTGQIPDWVVGKKGSSPKPKATKATKVTPAAALAKLQDIHQRCTSLDPSQIAQEVQGLSSLTVKELQDVQREFLGVAIGKKKEELLAALQKKIDDSRASRDRVDGILAY